MSRRNDIKAPKRKTNKSWEVGKLLYEVDAFGESLPSFNIKGNKQVNTRVGGVASLLIISLVLAFGALKFEQLLSHKNPNLSSYFKDLEAG